jgi:hypothetical protein
MGRLHLPVCKTLSMFHAQNYLIYLRRIRIDVGIVEGILILSAISV